MRYYELTAEQRRVARWLVTALAEAGVTVPCRTDVAAVTLMQVADWYPQALDWSQEEMTLAELCELTGWTAPVATSAP